MDGVPQDLSVPRVLVALTWGWWQQEPAQEAVAQLRVFGILKEHTWKREK